MSEPSASAGKSTGGRVDKPKPLPTQVAKIVRAPIRPLTQAVLTKPHSFSTTCHEFAAVAAGSTCLFSVPGDSFSLLL